MSWWPIFVPYLAAATFPVVCLNGNFSKFVGEHHEIPNIITIVWTVFAVCGIAGIGMSMKYGSKWQLLVALLSIPAFVPIAGLSFTLLYMMGFIGFGVI
ncbi:hypothetical protein [Planctopirus hydrillae]|uniref:Uncharacterized protein n=1 Tax=Planctopirus hydrillae TaxID=1841610 RepID=A0A1C3E567_9PLAN|nr:hypothetical protein [Planctopirus hydrillae]ODA28388.1 hypothetical protein A6X21_11650 [Planctopirus hydrillae]